MTSCLGGTCLRHHKAPPHITVVIGTAGAQQVCISLCHPTSKIMVEGEALISLDYEVFGKVQGVFFRKYTQAEGSRLGLVGWVQNTEHGTVRGQLQGEVAKVRQMQDWLQKTGSPKSRITGAQFQNEKGIQQLEYSIFQIRK